MKRKLIFLAGIHGVGKGHFAEYLHRELGVDIYSASTLIKEEKQRPVDESKIVIDPDENQDLLVSAFFRIKSESQVILLDGHFVLLMDKGLFKIPVETYQGLEVDLIIIKTLDVETVYKRLTDRDGISPDKSILEDMQVEEEKRAIDVAGLLSIPILRLDNEEYTSVMKDIERHLKTGGGAD